MKKLPIQQRLSSEKKLHYKMYKVNKNWLFAAITTISFAGFLTVGVNKPQAAITTSSNTTAQATAPSNPAQTTSQNSQTATAKATTTAPTTKPTVPTKTVATSPATTTAEVAKQTTTAAATVTTTAPTTKSAAPTKAATTPAAPKATLQTISAQTKPAGQPTSTTTNTSNTQTPASTPAKKVATPQPAKTDLTQIAAANKVSATPVAKPKTVVSTTTTTQPISAANTADLEAAKKAALAESKGGPVTVTALAAPTSPAPTSTTPDKAAAQKVVDSANTAAAALNTAIDQFNQDLKSQNLATTAGQTALQKDLANLSTQEQNLTTSGDQAATAISEYQQELASYQKSTGVTQPAAVKAITVGKTSQTPATASEYTDLLNQVANQINSNDNPKISTTGTMLQAQMTLSQNLAALQKAISQATTDANNANAVSDGKGGYTTTSTNTKIATDISDLTQDQQNYATAVTAYNSVATAYNTQAKKTVVQPVDTTKNSTAAQLTDFTNSVTTVATQNEAASLYNNLKVGAQYSAANDAYTALNNELTTWKNDVGVATQQAGATTYTSNSYNDLVQQFNNATASDPTALSTQYQKVLADQNALIGTDGKPGLLNAFATANSNYLAAKNAYETLTKSSATVTSPTDTALQTSITDIQNIITTNTKTEAANTAAITNFAPIIKDTTQLNKNLTQLNNLAGNVSTAATNWNTDVSNFNSMTAKTFNIGTVTAIAPAAVAYVQASDAYNDMLYGAKTATNRTYQYLGGSTDTAFDANKVLINIAANTTYDGTTHAGTIIDTDLNQLTTDINSYNTQNPGHSLTTPDTSDIQKTITTNQSKLLTADELGAINTSLLAIENLTPDTSTNATAEQTLAKSYFTAPTPTTEGNDYMGLFAGTYNNIKKPQALYGMINKQLYSNRVTIQPLEMTSGSGINSNTTTSVGTTAASFTGTFGFYFVNSTDPDYDQYISKNTDGTDTVYSTASKNHLASDPHITIPASEIIDVDPTSTQVTAYSVAGAVNNAIYTSTDDGSTLQFKDATYTDPDNNTTYYLAGYAVTQGEVSDTTIPSAGIIKIAQASFTGNNNTVAIQKSSDNASDIYLFYQPLPKLLTIASTTLQAPAVITPATTDFSSLRPNLQTLNSASVSAEPEALTAPTQTAVTKRLTYQAGSLSLSALAPFSQAPIVTLNDAKQPSIPDNPTTGDIFIQYVDATHPNGPYDLHKDNLHKLGKLGKKVSTYTSGTPDYPDNPGEQGNTSNPPAATHTPNEPQQPNQPKQPTTLTPTVHLGKTVTTLSTNNNPHDAKQPKQALGTVVDDAYGAWNKAGVSTSQQGQNFSGQQAGQFVDSDVIQFNKGGQSGQGSSQAYADQWTSSNTSFNTSSNNNGNNTHGQFDQGQANGTAKLTDASQGLPQTSDKNQAGLSILGTIMVALGSLFVGFKKRRKFDK